MDTVVFSHVVLDDIVEADEHLISGVLGGAGAYAAVGAAFVGRGARGVGVVSGVGEDFDEALLTDRGVDAGGLRVVDAHTPRTLIKYRANGEREESSQRGQAHFLAANPWPRNMPETWDPRAVYVFRDLDPEFWREIDESAGVSRARVLWELHAGICRPEARQAVLTRTARVDAVSLNRLEAFTLFGEDDIEASAARLLDAGTRWVFIRLGAHGAYATDGTTALYARPVPRPVRDPTGAGNAFSGAAAACLGAGDGLEDTLRSSMAAAALTISDHGPPPLTTRSLADFHVIRESVPTSATTSRH